MDQSPSTTTIHYQTSRWMREIKPVNSPDLYYELGQVVSVQVKSEHHPISGVLAVTKVHGSGGTEFYCQAHNAVYPFGGRCPECADAVAVAIEAGGTTCPGQ